MGFPVILRKTGMVVAKNAPTILTTVSVVGVVATVIFSVQATTKADLLMEELRQKKAKNEKITATEVIKTVGPTYAPTIIAGGITIGCIIGAAKISARRNAVISGLYAASEFALKEYQKKVIERLGEKEHKAVRDEIAQDQLNAHPVQNSQVILTGKGDHLCRDSLSGRYFRSDIEKIRKAQNDLNRAIINNMYISLNEVYEELGLEEVELGKYSGWDVDHLLDFSFSSGISTEGEPCLVLNYGEAPQQRRYGY